MEATKLLLLLRKCTISNLATQGKLIHQRILTLGLHNNIALCKNLISFYFSCHQYESAKLVFNSIDNPLDISLWNSLITAYTKNHLHTEALELFHSLLQYPYLKPDVFTFPSVLKSCGGLGRVNYGKMLHTQLLKCGLLFDVVVSSSLVGFYAKCNLFADAVQLFDEITERDVVNWNTVISCYYQDGKPEKALELFEKMRASGFEPSPVTLTVAISSCARLLDLERGRWIHRELVKNKVSLDVYVCSALVDMYGKCGCLDMAKEVFEQMPRKNIFAWNSMIAAYGSIGDSKECIELFKRMIAEGVKPTLATLNGMIMASSRSSQLQHGKCIHGYMTRNRIEADLFIIGALIDLYFKCGKVKSAENIFNMAPRKDVVCWNVMISGYVLVADYFRALDSYRAMQEAGVQPDAITFSSILPACSQLGALEEGKEIHRYIMGSGLEANERVMGALLDMYAKCGAVDEAFDIFIKLPHKDLVSWTSMITAYGSNGHALKALELFGEMQLSNVQPDSVTFLALLSACSHAGLVDEGHYYFNHMTSRYQIKPGIEHFSCLIDLLGRAGRLDEAYWILINNPEIGEDADLLSTLCSACCLHRNLELGEEVAKLLIEKNPEESSTYITLSNMYASMEKWNEVGRVRTKMKEMRMSKKPGCSWIELDNKIQAFIAEDKSHAEAEILQQWLAILAQHMGKHDIMLYEDHLEND